MNFANKEETSIDLIMMILWGTNKLIDFNSGLNALLNKDNSSPINQTYGWQIRERFISNSHQTHDRINMGESQPNKEIGYLTSDSCFNEVNIEILGEQDEK